MKINSETKIVGIFAYPVGHSLSPPMHNSAFSHLQLNYIYLPFEVKRENLKNAVLSLKSLNITGVNVSVPHKETVIKYLDEVSEDALKIGAVNTIKNSDGKLFGFNTDKSGFINSLKNEKIKLPGKKVVVLGCGGGSRAVCFGLLEEGILNLVITDVIKEKVEKLKRYLKKFYRDREIRGILYNEEKIFEELKDADLLINATPVGMKPNINSTPISKIPKENKNLVVYDLVYNPLKTKLLRIAEEQNLKTISGLEMLVLQGAASFEIWTGEKAPVEIMRKEVKKYL
jgi:shikimate dehydrogenase